MEFTVYGHEIIAGSDVGMHFSATLEQSRAEVAAYREAMIRFDPIGEPLGALGIHEMVLRMPDVETMIVLLNSPYSLFATCLTSRKLVDIAAD
ncbi:MULTISPECIES: hypothetical protein [Rhizobium]|uniref:hypothetical protein n=1 Tax=Rhizobium TaxID=379 RepID=UPI0007EBBD79|nr:MULTISPECIES: hypothetical protein [Rhizobium]ANL04685.1 hypothetical protein AMJ99_CH03163 [Rhizobium esperanzae]ANM35530.1 hypothetical protein AMK04_CH03167 [Rhizobium sp. N871]